MRVGRARAASESELMPEGRHEGDVVSRESSPMTATDDNELECEPLAPALGILLVDDNSQIRRLLGLLLADAGHRVLSAANGTDAMAILHASPDAVDLLLTDMVLPDMPGSEVARRALKLHPGLHVIYTSGYQEDPTFRSGDGFLAKPFTDTELSAAISLAVGPPSS
jgi:CheY-like chemotaxis protein